MANTSQARKRVRQNERHRLHNASLKSMCRTYMKKVVAAIEGGKKAEAEAAYKEVAPTLDRMVCKGLMHKNKVARHKSRFTKHIKAMQG